jgi:hypothetical protein
MNENQRLENQIDQQIKILDAYTHPQLSQELATRIVRAMTHPKRQTGLFRLILQIGLPLAAAAGLLLAVGIGHFAKSATLGKSNGTETASIWSLYPGSQEKEMDSLFADLDFSSATTQPAATQATDEIAEEMDRYLMEIVARS